MTKKSIIKIVKFGRHCVVRTTGQGLKSWRTRDLRGRCDWLRKTQKRKTQIQKNAEFAGK